MDEKKIASRQGEQTGNFVGMPVDVYAKTVQNLAELVGDSTRYGDILGSFREGEGTVSLRKRYMLKAIDEAWVNVIEDTIPCLDLIIRRPGRMLEEEEELRPVEQTRRVTARSILHLSQHTDLINEVRGDGTVMPSKLLNVFQDETVLTYENKFINTLIWRLYAFVRLRVEAAEACGEDEKLSELKMDRTFQDGEKKGTISLKISVSEKPEPNEVLKNYVYTSDLWKRVLRIDRVIQAYMGSEFIQSMGKNYIRPPVMHTNILLKNADFRQCLTLWQFMEGYENFGYETLVQEDIESLSDPCIRDFYRTFAEQYVLFDAHVKNDFATDRQTDFRQLDEAVPYQLQTELDPTDPTDYTYVGRVPSGHPMEETEYDAYEEWTDFAVRVAIAADQRLWELERRKVGTFFQYRLSFLARMILAQDPAQDYYTHIKNHLLSYKKVKARISWNHEQFSQGRIKCARLNVRGKTLCVYLPLNSSEMDPKYHLEDVSEFAAGEEFPSMIRVRSARGMKYAMQLIDMVMEAYGIEKTEDAPYRDYHMTYATPEELAMRVPPLVRIIGQRTQDAESPFGDGGEEEDAVAAMADASDVEEVVPPANHTVFYRYRYSFLARYIQSDGLLQRYYGAIKNYILSYAKVKSSIAWQHESFRFGRKTLLQIKIRGKTILMQFALDPAQYADTKYHVKDLREQGRTTDLPAVFRVRSLRSVAYAKDLVDEVMRTVGAEKGELPAVDYGMPYQTTEELLRLPTPLIKEVVSATRGIPMRSRTLPVTEEIEQNENEPNEENRIADENRSSETGDAEIGLTEGGDGSDGIRMDYGEENH